MKKMLFVGAVVLILTGCITPVATTALFNPGVTVAKKQRDLDQCKIASFRQVPQTVVSHVSGGYYHAGDVRCRERTGDKDKGKGVYCERVGQVYIPPSTTMRDVNANLRWRFVRGCLEDKGYRVVEQLRGCLDAAERQRALAARSVADLVCNPDPKLDY